MSITTFHQATADVNLVKVSPLKLKCLVQLKHITELATQTRQIASVLIWVTDYLSNQQRVGRSLRSVIRLNIFMN